MDPVWRSNATNSISHTTVENGAWWEVDLGQAYHLDHVRLFDRSGYPEQLSDFFVIVYRGGSEIWKSPKISRVSVSGGGSLRVDLPAGTVGDRIRIQNDNDVNRPLVLVECEVFTRGVPGLAGINSVTVGADGTRVYTTADSGAVSVFARTRSGRLNQDIVGQFFPTILYRNTTNWPESTFTGPPDDVYGANLPNGAEIIYDFGSNRILEGSRNCFNVYEVDGGTAEFGTIRVAVAGDDLIFVDVTSTAGPALSIPGDEAHSDSSFARSYGTAGKRVRYVRISAASAGFDLDAIGAFVVAGPAGVIPGSSHLDEVIGGDRRVLYVTSEGSTALHRLDVSSPAAAARLDDVEPGIGNLRAITAIPDPSLLLWEGFGNGDAGDLALATNPYAGRWTVVDQGTVAAPSHWYVSGGTLVQGSNIYGGGTSSNRLGTYLYYEDEANNSYAWQDYELTVDLRCRDNDGIGVLFRYTDPYNYYKLEMDRERTFRAIVRVENGVETQLARTNSVTNYAVGQWFQLRITVTTEDGGTRIRVIAGEVTEWFNVLDGTSSLTHGTVAMYCWGQQGADFDNVQVRRLPSSPASDFSKVYVLGKNAVGAYQVDPVSFSLSAMDTANFAGNNPVGLHVAGDRIYVADPGANAVHAFDWIFANYDASFQPAANFYTYAEAGRNESPFSVVAADLNGDGAIDLVTANWFSEPSNVSVLWGNGDGTFQTPTTFQLGGKSPGEVALGDFDGDGWLDIVTANYWSHDVSVLLNRRDGTFTPASRFATGVEPRSIDLADLNGDGLLDIVTANYKYSRVAVLLGNGDGTFQSAIEFPTGNNRPVSVAVGDVNGDGWPDVITGNSANNSVSVLLNTEDADGSFGKRFLKMHADIPVGEWPGSITTADLNGDGQLDIVTANSGPNNVSVLLGNGDGTFQLAVNFNVNGLNPESVAVADLNGDGVLDLVTANSSYPRGTVSVLRGIGDGTFLPALNFNVERFPKSVAVADLNGDGIPDLVAANWKSLSESGASLERGSVSVLLGEGSWKFGPLATTTAQEARLPEQPLALSGLQSVAVSPDGGFVYAVNAESHALVALGLDEAGALSLIDSYVDGCFNQDLLVDGLNGARQVALNPVHDELYVVAPGDPGGRCLPTKSGPLRRPGRDAYLPPASARRRGRDRTGRLARRPDGLHQRPRGAEHLGTHRRRIAGHDSRAA
jgi:hypothetical protein